MFSPTRTTNTSHHRMRCSSSSASTASSPVPIQPPCLMHIWIYWTFSYKSCHGFCQFPFTFHPGPTSRQSAPFWEPRCPYLPSKPSITYLGFSISVCEQLLPPDYFNPYPTAFPYGNGMVLHFYQQQESSMTKTVHKVINKGLKTYV